MTRRNGAVHIAFVPKIVGRMNIIAAFSSMPLLIATISAAPVRFVEKKYAVYTRLTDIGINDSANSGNAADAADISSASLLKMRITGTSSRNNTAYIKTDNTPFIIIPLRKNDFSSAVSFLP